MIRYRRNALLTLTFLGIILCSTVAVANAQSGETVLGWQVMPGGGNVSESDGVITLSGNEQAAGTTLYTSIAPASDFEISMQVKAETLGQVNSDPQGAGEGFLIMLRPNSSVFSQPIGMNLELRGRGGGQFLVTRHDTLCDMYGWYCDWTPFVYNSLRFNNGTSFWNGSLPADAPVQPGVWYTMTLKIQQHPFIVTAEVYAPNGTMVGFYPVADINNCGFSDLKCVGISSAFGGTFYIRNVTGVFAPFTPEPAPTPSSGPILNGSILIATDTSATVGSLVNVTGRLSGEDGSPLTNQFVAVLYTFNGADGWVPLTYAQTDADGKYSVQWMNIATGTFTLKAQWNGNSLYSPVSAVTTLSSLPGVNDKVFFVESNSTVSSFAFNSISSELSFTVSGPTGSGGYTKVTIAKTLCPSTDGLTVTIDGVPLDYVLSDSGDSWLLLFYYSHSSHNVNMYLPQVEPSPATTQQPTGTNDNNQTLDLTPTLIIALSGIIVALVAVGTLVYFKKRKKS